MFKKTIAAAKDLTDTHHTVNVQVAVDATPVLKPATKLIVTAAAVKVIAHIAIKVIDAKSSNA